MIPGFTSKAGWDRRVRMIGGVGAYPESAPFAPSEEYPELSGRPWAGPGREANGVYAAVRMLLASLGLDDARFGSAAWNPLGALVRPGGTVTIKPNEVRHWNGNPRGTWQSVVTHWSVVRPLIDHALLAVGEEGTVIVGDAPHWDCDIGTLESLLGVAAFRRHYETLAAGRVRFVDFRPHWYRCVGPVQGRRRELPGDPAGYVRVDLGAASHFHDPAVVPRLLYGSGYDHRDTVRAHSGGRHEYQIAGSALASDLFINVPKLKTHHLLGITVAMKNLVGINGNKNRLPHFRLGFADEGGDQYPDRRPALEWRMRVLRAALPVLARCTPLRVAWGGLLAFVHRRGGRNPYAGGAWSGNDTVWRMALDLNRALLYADQDGQLCDAPARTYLTVVDGIVAGEGDGPMEPQDRAAGLLLGAGHPLPCDLVAAQLMGFDGPRLRLCAEGMKPRDRTLTPITAPEDIELAALDLAGTAGWRAVAWRDIPDLSFAPPTGWGDALRRGSATEQEERAGAAPE